MAFIKINSILKKRGQNEVRIIPAAVNGARIKVLVGSCAHCAKLRDNVIAAMKQANIPETELEIKMLLLANSALDDDGNQYYNDAASGVTIVWSNHGSSVSRWNFYDESTDYCDINTENEIDVMLMRGVIPVFVSCKNGAVDSNELYKLNTVADRFGSIYAKKIIAATYLGKMGSGREMDPFRRRAEEMGIELIENAHLMNDDELLARLKKATE